MAPPDLHLLIHRNSQQEACIYLSRGPRESRSRPSIDMLFRSAAILLTSQVVGIRMTGMLDDGVEGLRTIQVCGGVTIVQEPAEARYPDMVNRAVATMQVDYKLPIIEISALLNKLAREPVEAKGQAPKEMQLEMAIHLKGSDDDLKGMRRIATQTTFTCPECGGHLWQVSADEPTHYLCEVGHSYTNQTLLEDMDYTVERALWKALRTLEERTRMLERLAEEQKAKGHNYVATDWEERAAETREDAQNLRRFLLKRVG